MSCAIFFLKLRKIILTILVSNLFLQVTGEVFYVTPSPRLCPTYAETCKNLSFYQRESRNYFRDNAVFVFLEGEHELQSEVIEFKNLSNLTFQCMIDTDARPDNETQSTAVLQCTEGIGGIAFINSHNITIKDITISNCGSLTLYHEPTALAVSDSSNVHFEGLFIQNSPYYGLVLVNVNNIIISHSLFSKNGIDGIQAMYHQPFISSVTDDRDLDIVNSTISYNGKNGFSVYFQQQEYIVNVRIKSSNITSNNVFNLAMISNNSCQYTLNVTGVVCNSSKTGGGILIQQNHTCIKKSVPSMSLRECIFAHNSITGLTISWYGNDQGNLYVDSSIFVGNNGVLGSALAIIQIEQPIFQNGTLLTVHLANLKFEKNKYNNKAAQVNGYTSELRFTVIVFSLNSITFNNCNFTDNVGSALGIYDSYVTFTGQNRFVNNTSIYGGALLLVNNGFILLHLDSQMIFIDNHAEISGGAIRVYQLLTRVYSRMRGGGLFEYCFYQLPTKLSGVSKLFYFQNNTAGIAGSAVYGDVTDNCAFFSKVEDVGENYFMSISTFVDQEGDSVISSGPRRVCFCVTDIKNCSLTAMSYEALPGHNVTFAAVVVGNKEGYTQGIIRVESANPIQSNMNIKTDAKCTMISYPIKIDSYNVTNDTITITLPEVEENLISNSLKINVAITECPKGFELSPSTGICECIQEITSKATCFPSDLLIERSGKTWIGIDQGCIIVTSNCPFDYCEFSSVNITLANASAQCAFGRNDRLCSRCSNDQSLVLGSNACKACNENASALILLPIAIAGIALVCLLLFLNLTVSVGTINGLIFFANTVKFYESIFPVKPIPFLGQFISWINLDLGIETCFYNGMSACGKLGLQFVFPFYLWTIITAIVIISRYSSKVANLIGNNAIPVLATLLLLSYTKLLRTVLLIFAVSPIECNEGSLLFYWYVDPSISYLHGCHRLLFVIATLVMFFLIIPYTLFLLMYPLFEVSSEKFRQKFSWFLFKLKPFFDAYRGPHTNLFYYYPGALLLIRIALALVIDLHREVNTPPDVLLGVSVVLVTVLSFGKVYKKGSYLHVIDISLLLNMAILAYIISHNENESFMTSTMAEYGTVLILCFSFFLFLIIFVYHFYKYTWIGKCSRKAISSLRGRKQTPSTSMDTQVQGYNDTHEGPILKISSIRLREPLLEDL